MWAKLELCNEVKEFIEYEKSHTESYEEIRRLVFTKERLNANYSFVEIINLSMMFQNIKISAINKILNKKELTFPEGFVIERLLAKYNDEEFLSVEEHMNQIKLNCSADYKSKRENDRKI